MIKAAIATVLATVLLAGCSAPSVLGLAVDRICATTTQLEREALRPRLDQRTHPHEVRIGCYEQESE